MEDPRKLSLRQYWAIAQSDPRCTCFQTTQDTNQDYSHYNYRQDKQEISFASHSASSLNSHHDGDENTSADSSVSISTREADSEAHSVPKAEARSSLTKAETRNQPSVARKSTKQRKTRTLFSPGQINVLEQVFKQYHYIASSQRKLLAQNIGISEAQVRVWFQNRRIKWRKEGKEFLVKM